MSTFYKKCLDKLAKRHYNTGKVGGAPTNEEVQ